MPGNIHNITNITNNTGWSNEDNNNCHKTG